MLAFISETWTNKWLCICKGDPRIKNKNNIREVVSIVMEMFYQRLQSLTYITPYLTITGIVLQIASYNYRNSSTNSMHEKNWTYTFYGNQLNFTEHILMVFRM